MDSSIKINIIRGTKLTKSDAKNVRALWIKQEQGELEIDKKTSYGTDIFFLVKDGAKLIAAGRLQKQNVEFRSKTYAILGIADIASKVKGAGHGRILMTSIRNYLADNKKTGVGFCAENNAGFYRKIGIKVNRQLISRFYSKLEGKETGDDVVIYFEKGCELIKDMRNHKGVAQIAWFW